MNIVRYKIPLLMYSCTENDPTYPNRCLVRNMEDVDVSEVKGVEELSGQYCWIYNYDEAENCGRLYENEKKTYGFNLREVVMKVVFIAGYYLAEFTTELSLDTIVTRDLGYKNPETMTLKEAIKAFLDGCISDGIGENEIGKVTYNSTTHDVWLGEATEIENASEVWHDANERPQKNKEKVAWLADNGTMYTGWYNKDAYGNEDMRDSICKFTFDEITTWAYVDDLLNL